jgi:hypothetical protein
VVTSAAGLRRPLSALRHHRAVRRAATSQLVALAMVSVLAAAYTVLAIQFPTWFPIAAATLWLMIGGFLLRLRYLLLYDVVVGLAVAVVSHERQLRAPGPGVLIVLVATALLVAAYARGRERVGVQGALGGSMLVDLRDRLRAQGVVPALEPGWHVETVLRAAYGDQFSGDFLVASRVGPSLELVLVDVSGKGQAAGTRALMLSGAFGGLLGALAPERFLPAANRYLLRQHWPEGFATAVHLSLDLPSGRFRVASAGHPPAAQLHSGSGRWVLLEGGQGPLLGVVTEPGFPAQAGVLNRGDALLLYTDGLVESPALDVGRGIDRLVGQAEIHLARGFAGGAARIVEGTRSGEGDDRALVLIWRS